MSTVKAALRAAKAAIDSQNYDEAVTQAEKVLADDPQNYHGNVFLGLAREKQQKHDASATAYRAATTIKPNDPLAWQGLISLYEKQGGRSVDGYKEAAVRLAEVYAEVDDKHKCQSVIDRYLLYARDNGTTRQYKDALEVTLPTSSIYETLEGRLPHPSHTYTRIAEIIETEEKERTNREIGARRTRLGAKVSQVTTEVKREVLGKSTLEDIYQNIIDWTNDDEVRRQYEEKLLRHAYDTLTTLPAEQKQLKRSRVEEVARGMVILKHPYPLAWHIVLEWKDAESMIEWDVGVLRDYVELFPEDGLAMVLQGFLESEASPFPASPDSPKADEEEADGVKKVPLSADDRLLLMTDGLQQSPKSALAHRLVADYYLFLEEYESAVETCGVAKKLVQSEAQKTGLRLQNNVDAVNIILATSLVYYQAPKNHPEARKLFEALLEREPTAAPALIGQGLILEEQEDYGGAIDILTRAVDRDPSNVKVKAEAAWCRALNGHRARGLEELERCLPNIDLSQPRAHDLKAQTLYRIGQCQWELDPSVKARKDRKGPYANFLAALQANINFAPAYTSLGIYYADYAKDRKRARKCFQKAFELSASEVEAAERLARAFADQAEWDLVDIVAQRVVASGKVRPAPGSKKKGFSWPFAALGVVELNKQEYAKSIVSFQAALRISPDDYHSWVGLGESYHNSGRYVAATRAFQQAARLENQVEGVKEGESWFAKYMLANVKRELGDYDEAVQDYQEVLGIRPGEFGVEIALLQTLVDGAWHSIETGFFGKAAGQAATAIDVALRVCETRSDAFNLWKAVGDACSIFSFVPGRSGSIPSSQIRQTLQIQGIGDEDAVLKDVDGVGADTLGQDSDQSLDTITTCLYAAILAHKRGIQASSSDHHAQAVAWYNLGWTEYRAHVCFSQADQSQSTRRYRSSKYLKASVQCFKAAIELEARNSEFWNALGVVTTTISPKIAQHSFVRSLHLNDKNARVWTNLGALYLLHKDHQLANDAFTRAQSTDPDCAPAWLGQGLLADLLGDQGEARSLFTHAFEIGDSSLLLAKQRYAISTFDELIGSPLGLKSDPADLVQPLLALQQLHTLTPHDQTSSYLLALYLERVGSYVSSIDILSSLHATLEEEYDVTESATSLARFASVNATLARVRLATGEYDEAVENAAIALSLTSEYIEGFEATPRLKLRHSARITSGLAYYHLDNLDEALQQLKAALEDPSSLPTSSSDSSTEPEIIRLIAQISFSKGTKTQQSSAKDRLFDVVERHPKHIENILLICAIALLERDWEGWDACREDLEALTTDGDGVDASTSRRILALNLAATAATAAQDPSSTESLIRNHITTTIMLHPHHPDGWTHLASLPEPSPSSSTTSDPSNTAAQMALLNTLRKVPPHGSVEAEELARAFWGTGVVGDGLRAVGIAPWLRGELVG
ncbi:MAG: Superkiller protein 3 [Caeruleum heppii]|nr:MAG: Superkiller protein 3 [Caeruleum heppii]